MLNRRAYPAWSVRLNGVALKASALPERTDGLIVVPLPAGKDTVDLAFGRTPDRTVGMGVSGVALLGLALGYRRRRRVE